MESSSPITTLGNRGDMGKFNFLEPLAGLGRWTEPMTLGQHKQVCGASEAASGRMFERAGRPNHIRMI